MLGFIDRFKLYIIGILLVSLAAGFIFHKMTVGFLENRISTLEGENGRLRVENATLIAANKQAAKDIDEQNKAVASLREAAVRQSTEAAAAMAAVAKERDRWSAKYAALLNTPPSGKDECQNIADLLSRYHITRVEEVRP